MKQIRTRYAGSCARCGTAIPSGAKAGWDQETRCLLCSDCSGMTADSETRTTLPIASLDVGQPGSSARREFARRKDRREGRIRTRHPHIGGLVLALGDDPQSTRAWQKGAQGEERLGAMLNRKVQKDGVVVLHDRRIPRSRSNIDHIVIAPRGVLVVDTKNYEGKLERRNVGGWFNPDVRLYVGRRDCSQLVVGAHRQADVVAAALGDGWPGSVVPVLCFTGAEWPLLASPLEIDKVVITWPRALLKLSAEPGKIDAAQIERAAERLAAILPKA